MTARSCNSVPFRLSRSAGDLAGSRRDDGDDLSPNRVPPTGRRSGCSPADDPDWSWLKWLPHVRLPDRNRCGRVRPADHRARSVGPGRARAYARFASGGPYVVVVDLRPAARRSSADGRAGVTVIVRRHRGSAYRIRVHEDGTADDRLLTK